MLPVMANIKSQIKDIRQNEVRRQHNTAIRSDLRTRIKKALETANSQDGEENLRLAIKAIDKAVAKKILHKNTGARKKSRLVRQLTNSST